jgi:hypothetical protein
MVESSGQMERVKVIYVNLICIRSVIFHTIINPMPCVIFEVSECYNKWCKTYRWSETQDCLAKAAFSRKAMFTTKLDSNWRKKLVKCHIWRTALYGPENWTIRAVDLKYLERLEMWCWRRMEKISWTDRVRNEEVLHKVKEKRNIVHTVKRR